MRQGAQGCCTGMAQRDGMGREVQGGFRMGNTISKSSQTINAGEGLKKRELSYTVGGNEN